MKLFDNANPNGLDLGPSRAFPKSMGRSAGVQAQAKRIQYAINAKQRSQRIEKNASKKNA